MLVWRCSIKKSLNENFKEITFVRECFFSKTVELQPVTLFKKASTGGIAT